MAAVSSVNADSFDPDLQTPLKQNFPKSMTFVTHQLGIQLHIMTYLYPVKRDTPMLTFVILLIVLVLFLYGFLAYKKFDNLIKNDVSRLFSEAVKGKQIIVTESMLEALPEPIKRYL